MSLRRRSATRCAPPSRCRSKTASRSTSTRTCWRSARSPTRCASACTATARSSTATCTSTRPTSARRAACSARSRASQPGDAGAYTMTHEEAWDRLRARVAAADAITEIHIVNGLHPGLPFDYYTELLAGLKRIQPSIHLKAFTAVEIYYFAKKFGMPVADVLARLRAAGLDSIPGGGAEIFAPRVRKKICDDKCTGDEWLDVHRTAHRIGLRSNCTMLYGTIETLEERVDHMLRLRALQDETGGFQTFIPLAFHPDNNALMKLPRADRRRGPAHLRGGAPDAPQHPAHQGVLDHAGRQDRADRALVRRRRPRRHRAGGAHLSHGRRRDAAGDEPGRDRPHHPQRRPHAGRTRHALQRRRRGRARWCRTSRSGATCAAVWRWCRERS